MRIRRLLIAVPLLLAFAVPAQAVETMYENDPQRQVKERIEELFGNYIINPSRRRPEEKVVLKDDTVEMWLLVDPRKPDSQRLKCDALRWSLFGRFGQGGPQGFFNEFPKFNKVELTIYHLKSTRTVDKDGKYNVTKTPVWSIRTRVERKFAERVDWNAIKPLDKEPKGDKEVDACVANIQKVLTTGRIQYNTKEYFK